MNWKCHVCDDGFDQRGNDSAAVITYGGDCYFLCPDCALEYVAPLIMLAPATESA